MVRRQKDKKTKVVSVEVKPVMLQMVGDVHETNAVEWIDGDGNQAGFRRHWFQPKGTTSPSDRVCLFRYREVGGDCAAAAAPAASECAPAEPVPRAMRAASARAAAPAGEVECGAGALVAGSWAGERDTRRTARRAGFNGLRRLGSSRSIICRSRVVLPTIPRKQRASRHTVTDTDRQAQTQTQRLTYTHTHTATHTHTDRRTDRHTHIQWHIQCHT